MAKRVCIIGAGPSGLVAAKTLLHNAPRGPDSFNVTIYESRDRVGGLWPTRKDDPGLSAVHPLMIANQSKHTVQFSDFAWRPEDPELPHAWMVGQYLEGYVQRYGIKDIKFRHRVRRAELLHDRRWRVTAAGEGGEETSVFDYLLVAAGFFGTPLVPKELVPERIPHCHSTEYRDLKSLLGDQAGTGNGGRILVVGGQMSGIEIAATIATHISSLTHSPVESPIPNPEQYTVSHIVQRPVWVFPLYTSPKPAQVSPPFVPLDLPSYNLSNRPPPLSNTQGHISEDAAKTMHSIFRTSMQTDQREFHPLLGFKDEDMTKPPYLAVSDHYLDFARSGLIEVSSEKLHSLNGCTAQLAPSGEHIENVAAVVFATGYEASSRLDFLSPEVLTTLNHSPSNIDLPLSLSFHGTHHRKIPTLGFVGFYRSPYWGVMEMQARFLAAFWTQQEMPPIDTSTDHTLLLRSDPRVSQFPMGDYAWLMQEFSNALGLTIRPFEPPTPPLPHNDKPMDILTPARYISPMANDEARNEAAKALGQTRSTAVAGLTSPKFVARAVFRSLLGTWKLEREIKSRSQYQPSGKFNGTAKFFLRSGTSDGLQCVSKDGEAPTSDDGAIWLEYLYVEDGTFIAENGLQFTATRRYVWRYDEKRDVLSVWFVKPDENKKVDYLFHELEFMAPPADEPERGWLAKSGHLCEEDYYGVQYEFKFQSVNLSQWSIEYSVRGPRKDYTLHGNYQR